MNPSVLTLGLYKGSGGPSKSIRAMSDALGAGVISWVDPIQYASDSLIWEESVVVKGSSRPVLRQLLWASTKATSEAESIISKSDLVSCHSPWRCHNQWMSKMSGRYGLPYWFVPHGGLDPYVFEEQKLIKKSFLSFGGRRFIENADCLIFTAKAERDKALKVCQPKRCEIIYWPLAEKDFSVKRTSAARHEVRQRLSIPSDARCLLFFGRLHPMKQPLETIRALAQSGGKSHLIIIGNEFGVTTKECKQLAEKLGIPERVHVIGPVYGDAKTAYFAAADAYISLSKRENFNFTAAESMAAGLPVILSPGNDLGGEIRGGECGWILEKDTLKEASQVIRLFESAPTATINYLGANGRAWAQDNLQFIHFKERILALAADIIKNHR